MRKLDWVWVCFFAYLLSYVPLIYLSNHAGVPPLAILPISTISCCLCAGVVALTTGWWKLLLVPSAARSAGISATPYNAAIMLLTPVAYAVAGPAASLATLTLMKLGSLLVAMPQRVTGSRAGGWVLAAAGLCCVAIVGAAYGTSLWSWSRGGPWLGLGLSGAGIAVAVAYWACYGKRLQKMGPYKHSLPFFSAEHGFAPLVAMAMLLAAVGVYWGLYGLGIPTGPLGDLADGFSLWRRWDLWALGAFSQLVGLTGGWILVGRTLSGSAMTLNRCAALLAGVVLVAMQGCHFTIEHSGALVVPVVLALLGRSKVTSS